MSDLCMYELEDNVWDDFGDTDYHIVPHTTDEYIAQLKVQGDSKKRPQREVIGVTGDTEYCPDSLFPSSGSNDSLKEVTTMASDDPRMSSHGLETGSDFCSDDPLLVDKCATENNDYRFPINHITAADDDLRFFNNNHEDKENGDLLYYGLGEIGNFEDVDRMFRCTGFMDMETDTNPIDRSIAHLLFHRPSDPSQRPVIDTAPVKSHGLIHGSITNPPLMLSEKQVVGNETGATGSDKKNADKLTACNW